jgi:hypothetical protein
LIFQELVQQPYINQVVLSPHVYCPSTSGAPDGYAGAELEYRLDQSFGQKGTFGWNGHVFPIVIGEFSIKWVSPWFKQTFLLWVLSARLSSRLVSTPPSRGFEKAWLWEGGTSLFFNLSW